MDVSSHQPRDLTALIQRHGIEHVVVRLYLPEEYPPAAHSLAQVESARANGCSVGTYLWAYRSLDPRRSVRDAVGLARLAGVEPPTMWIDCETYKERGQPGYDPGPDAAWLRAAIDECRRLDVRPGIYTGYWWWNGYLSNTKEFGDVALWTAQYDHDPALATSKPYGGWTGEMIKGKQFSADGLDLNTFAHEVTVPLSS